MLCPNLDLTYFFHPSFVDITLFCDLKVLILIFNGRNIFSYLFNQHLINIFYVNVAIKLVLFTLTLFLSLS